VREVLEEEVAPDGFEGVGLVVEIDEETGVDEAVVGSTGPLSEGVGLVEALLVVEAQLSGGRGTELMNLRCDLGFSTMEKDLPAPACTSDALMYCVP
jgi:hypothetical protein